MQTKANQLRLVFRKLYNREILPGECIALSSSRSLDTPSDMLAVLYAGGAFVPFNSRDPEDRTRYILEDSGAKISIISGSAVCNSSGIRFSLSNDIEDAAEKPFATEPCQLAYIMYTSGSTGKPKGVRISHKALWHYLKWFESLEVMQNVSRVDLSINLTFDASITTSLVALACGKAISICPEEIKESPRAFIYYLSDKKIDLCKCTPSYFKLLTNEVNQYGTCITQPIVWLLSGEEMNVKDTADWLKLHPSHIFYNSYGPTEATVTCSKFRVDRHNITQFTSSIPIAHLDRSAHFHILDEQMRPVTHGVRGELFIEGAVLADGYQNNTEKTAQAFIRDSRGHVLYRTGDYVTSSDDGMINYHGRLDDQLKIRGVRVELGEIRQVICAHPSVFDAKVIAHTVEESIQLIAFVVIKKQEFLEEVLHDLLKKHLLNTLPAVMIPQKLIFLETLPFNQAGKVDVAAMHALAKVHSFDREKSLVVNPLEMSILNIWRQTLSNRKIGSNSNFFNLGGNSLLAMEVMDRINRHLDSAFPVHLLFQKPTIRELAQAIADKHQTTFFHHFLHHNQGPRVVFIHPATGLVLPYFALTKYMPAVDFYGLSSNRFGDRQSNYATLEEMAQSYLKVLDPLLGERPLILGGFCTGGAVAYEMAKQLERDGKHINGLILIDSYKLQSFGSKKSREATWLALLTNIGVDPQSILGMNIAYEMEQSRRLIANYTPTPHDGPTLLVQCNSIDEDDVNREHLQRLTPLMNGWSGSISTQSLTQVSLNASHKTIMNDESCLRSVGEAVDSFVQSLAPGCTNVCRT
ncbi:MAG: AMP-binding protein [Proteobacteria bacterium]|nr:AMP-binding protein [Pseudomonadota bacterium]